jgi:hypothetical protein
VEGRLTSVLVTTTLDLRVLRGFLVLGTAVGGVRCGAVDWLRVLGRGIFASVDVRDGDEDLGIDYVPWEWFPLFLTERHWVFRYRTSLRSPDSRKVV